MPRCHYIKRVHFLIMSVLQFNLTENFMRRDLISYLFDHKILFNQMLHLKYFSIGGRVNLKVFKTEHCYTSEVNSRFSLESLSIESSSLYL